MDLESVAVRRQLGRQISTPRMPIWCWGLGACLHGVHRLARKERRKRDKITGPPISREVGVAGKTGEVNKRIKRPQFQEVLKKNTPREKGATRTKCDSESRRQQQRKSLKKASMALEGISMAGGGN